MGHQCRFIKGVWYKTADRGSQYCSHSFQAALTSYGMRSSMSRKGNSRDNDSAERLWGGLKVTRL